MADEAAQFLGAGHAQQGMAARVHNPFAVYHPIVGFAFLAIAIVFSMAAFHPIYVIIAFLGALSAACVTRGVKPALRSLPFMIVMAAIIAIANMVFVPAGSTVLFNLFGRDFYLEALCYGATTGGMFAAMLLWFTVYAAVMDSESTAAVMGSVFPTISLMISQVMRLVPQFIRRGHDIGSVSSCTTAARSQAAKDKVRQSLRTLSVLMGWGMEDGIQRSDSMRARGYGCGITRTRYRRQRFALRDVIAIGCMIVLTALNAFLASVACSQFSYYPVMDHLVLWWGYVPYILFVAIPLLIAGKEWLSWL